MSKKKKKESFDVHLMRKLLFASSSSHTTSLPPKITNQALEAASFLVGQFISEARVRASMEAEFDTDAEFYLGNSNEKNEKKTNDAYYDDDDDDTHDENDIVEMNIHSKDEEKEDEHSHSNPKYSTVTSTTTSSFFPNNTTKRLSFHTNNSKEEDKLHKMKEIQAKHVLNVAAELLLDFT